MTNKKTTKRTLVVSVLSIVVCFAMLIGSTFAWFTDSATTGVNIIKSGNLDVGFEYADGKDNPASANWQNAEKAKIFDYQLWEPGYTVAKHIKISNNGSLALKYQVSFKLDGAIGKLAEAIDVYFIDPASAITTRSDVDNLTSIGTLNNFLTGDVVFGELEAGKSNMVTVVLKMKEEANNDYQNKSVGDGLTIIINATQDTVESDSFDNKYDKGAMLPDEKLVVTNNETLTEAIEAKTDYIVNAGEYSRVVVADSSNVTVSGADFKLGNSNNQIASVKNGGTLTLLDATTPINQTSFSMIANVTSSGTLIIKGGHYSAGMIAIGDSTGKVIIEGGIFDSLFFIKGPGASVDIEIRGGRFQDTFALFGENIADYVDTANYDITYQGGYYTVSEK